MEFESLKCNEILYGMAWTKQEPPKLHEAHTFQKKLLCLVKSLTI